MYADFFRQNKHPRLGNRTYVSSNIMASMMYPKKQIEKSLGKQQKNPQKIDLHQYDSVMASPRKQSIRIHQPTYQRNTSQLKYQQQNNHKKLSVPFQQKQQKMLRSKLSNYGTSSLKNLPKMISDRDVESIQAKNFDIISGNPLQASRKSLPKQKIIQNYMDSLNKLQPKDALTSKKKFDPEGYNGITTVEQNLRIQRNNKHLQRPYYLNNADDLYF